MPWIARRARGLFWAVSRHFFRTIIRFVLKPIFAILYGRHLPHFSSDFEGERAYMLSELKGGEAGWSGTRIDE